MVVKVDNFYIDIYAPIVLFCFNRPQLLALTLSSLSKNPEAQHSKLYVYCDAAKRPSDSLLVRQCQDIVNSQNGFESISLIVREKNYGLAKNIIDGISRTLEKEQRVIVLEDDIEVGKHFLSYMNSALKMYQNEQSVWHVSGWNYPLEREDLPELFFWRVMNCWGWATWKDRWAHFEKEPEHLVNTFSAEEIYRFNLDGTYDFFQQIRDNYIGKIDTWAIFWYATIFRNQGLCLNPTSTLVNNTGFGIEASHCICSKSYFDNISETHLKRWPAIMEESVTVTKKIKKLLREDGSALPIDLDEFNLTQSEKGQLISLLSKQNLTLKSPLQQMWYLMDLVWDEMQLNNQDIDFKKLDEYYAHPVWLLNGLFTRSHSVSVLHREQLAKWISSRKDIGLISDVGGGVGVLAEIISQYNPASLVDVLEPYPTAYAKRVLGSIKNVNFTASLSERYDCLTLVDVLEHVTDPIDMMFNLLPYLREDGYIVMGNCFEPVIKCHLPVTFHFKYSFSDVMTALGFEFETTIADTHFEVYRHVASPDLNKARKIESLSQKMYQKMLDDPAPPSSFNDNLRLNGLVSKFYSAVDKWEIQSNQYIIYGSGTGARLIHDAIPENVSCFVDRNASKWDSEFLGKKVYSPDVLLSSCEKIIISVLGRERQVVEYLTDIIGVARDRLVTLSL